MDVTIRAMAVRLASAMGLIVAVVAALAGAGGAANDDVEGAGEPSVVDPSPVGAWSLPVDDCATSVEHRRLDRNVGPADGIEAPAHAERVAERADGPFQITEPPAAPTTTVPAGPQAPADSGEGRRIVYSKTEQRVWLVEADERVVRTYLVSGNRSPNLPTPGEYSVTSRSATSFALSNPHIVWRFMVRFTTGPAGDNIGFHEIPVDQRTGAPVQGEAQLGQALSAGCIRQATADAVFLWEWAPIGTTVVVLP